jgi:signal transduction histidine kinase
VRSAVKHSGTRNVEVRLLGIQDQVQLTIRDRGKGFDPEITMAVKGLGLVSMQEIETVGGTEIIVRIPATFEKCRPKRDRSMKPKNR